MRRIVAAGAIGGVLEWYDFAIFGYFALEIGQAFFPRQDPVAQLLAAFGVFAVGYVMRPLGGLISGSIGDRLGRRAALAFSMATMALPTFLVAVLPGHQTLGAAAPILLTVLRMLQGLSVGGECTTAFTFVIEHAPPHRRGLAGATSLCGNTAGILLGSATGTDPITADNPNQLGIFVGGVALQSAILAGPTAYAYYAFLRYPPPAGTQEPTDRVPPTAGATFQMQGT